MKFRRKPVERTVVDALLVDGNYVYVGDDGKLITKEANAFLLDFDPIKRSPSTKPRKTRKKKDQTAAT